MKHKFVQIMNRRKCSELLFIFVFVLFPKILLSQKNSFQLIDELNFTPISNATIQSLNEDYSTQSDSLGIFIFDNKHIVSINAAGYEPMNIDLNKISTKIKLTKKAYEINEINLSKAKMNKFYVLDPVKNNTISIALGKIENLQLGKLFTPNNMRLKYINKLNIFTNKVYHDKKIAIRIYNVNINNEPDSEIFIENPIAIAKKGTRKTSIDLSKYNIKIPENGIIISVYWLKTGTNSTDTFHLPYNDVVFRGYYEPKDSKKCFIYNGPNWQLFTHKNMNICVAMELVLSD